MDSSKVTEAGKTDLIVDESGHIFLIPTPTDDLADPLNWSATRKWSIVILLIIWSATALSVQSFLSNFYPSIQTRFPKASTSQINLLFTIVTPMVVPGELFFAPLAIAHGRRFSLLLSIIFLFASTLWGAQSQTYGALLGARIVEGFAGGPTDAMGFTIIQDMTFVHERGKMLGAMMMGQQALVLVLAIATNYMAVSYGFSAPFYLFFGLACFVFVTLFFAMPETRYFRDEFALHHGRITVADYSQWRASLQTNSQYQPFTFKRQIKIVAPAGKAESDNAFQFLKGLLLMFTSPVIWWSGLLNAVMTG